MGGCDGARAARQAPGRAPPGAMTAVHRRRFLISILSAGLPARHALAQPARPAKIGALTESWGPTPAIVGLRDGLQALGIREDRDFALGVRFTQGKAADLPAAAR